MSWYFVGWFAAGVSDIMACMILLHLFRKGVTLKNDVCKRCKYILVTSSSHCPECGTELSQSTILHKGELKMSARFRLILCWLLLLVLPVRLLFYSVEPPTRVANYAGVFVCDKDLIGDRQVVSSDGVFRTVKAKNTLQGVDRFTLAVPSDVTKDSLLNTIAQDKTKLDCLVTIQKEDGTTSTMLIMAGANQFILNQGLEAEQTVHRVPTVQDYAQLAGHTDSLLNSKAMRTLGLFLESTFAMMKIPNPTGGVRSIQFVNNCVHMSAGSRRAKRDSVWDTYVPFILLILFFIWFIGVVLIIEWSPTRSSAGSTATH